jgi:thioesterase domain-containing protein
MPGAGGNVLSLRPLSRTLGDQQPLFALQAAGLDGKAAPLSVAQTARANIDALKTIQPTGPYSLIGHSYGGVVAYEMAKQLSEQGDEVSSLVLLDSIAPSVVQRKPADDEVAELVDACMAIADLYIQDLAIDVVAMRQSPYNENLQYIVGLLEARGLEFNADQLATFHRVYRANLRCYYAYKPSRQSRHIDVSLYRATQTRQNGPHMPGDYGWNQLLLIPIRAYDVDATHFSILTKVELQGVVGQFATSSAGG